ncbi:MAG: hypothetical protein JKY65_12345 [Planctomycetes bacterium]|nr:hypothetical protein [Planctomycetota bacterium]
MRERRLRIAALFLGALLLTGCYQAHYLVQIDQLPLYAAPGSDQVVARLPRFHHEALAGGLPAEGAEFVALSFRGREGFAPRAGLVLFEYLEPEAFGAGDRNRKLRSRLRTAQVEAFGRDWPLEVANAVREGRVFRGMTPHQVEVSWGWPDQVLRGPGGLQSWVYTQERTHVVQTYRAGAAYYYSGPLLGPRWGSSSGWQSRSERYLERRVVTIGPGGTVVGIEITQTRI